MLLLLDLIVGEVVDGDVVHRRLIHAALVVVHSPSPPNRRFSIFSIRAGWKHRAPTPPRPSEPKFHVEDSAIFLQGITVRHTGNIIANGPRRSAITGHAALHKPIFG